jgi:hypothetical protein
MKERAEKIILNITSGNRVGGKQRYDDHIDHRRRGARGGPRGGGVVHPYLLGAAR